MKILLAEDDELTREGLAEVLRAEGYDVFQAENGLEALRLFESEGPDFVCLDVMMPEMDGYEVCRQIRMKDSQVPVVFITAKGEEIDTVVGLELGADDYIVKPFGTKAVIARIRAVTRRLNSSREDDESGLDEFVMDDLRIFPSQLRAVRGQEVIDLGLKDIKLLRLFFDNRTKVLDRNTIMNECWGVDYLPSSRTLDQHISQLRRKIEKNPSNPSIIRTVHGAGYRYD